jgi:serine/threonine protein kinase/tetratricopeptide (TPR) repeat protein
MSSIDFRRAECIFDGAKDLPPPEQREYVLRSCPDDDVLQEMILRLLGHDAHTDGFLDAPILVDRFRSAGGVERPERIGPYRIVDVLGEGGMGIVFLAEHDAGRRVALKVIRPGISSARALERFRGEADIAGGLDHPGIASIHESGMLDAGQGSQPFLAMELIEGQSITRYAAERKLAVAERLELLAKICDAVHYAHQRGVIHRDLKPGNILVDAAGQPKVLDFGVARATEDHRSTKHRTAPGELIGTLPYMSPEQAGGETAEVDTRSDVYALGVVLYELLTGRLPYDVSDRRIHEAVRTIIEDAPTPLHRIVPQLARDIETIDGMALAKDKRDRYQSASDLASDLRRHIAGDPIRARAPGAFDQIKSLSRRHRTVFVSLFSILLILLVATSVTGMLLVEARTQRDAAHEARLLAEQAELEALHLRNAERRKRLDAEHEARLMQALSEFWQEDFIVVPIGASQADAKIVEVLDRAAAHVDANYDDDPLLKATIQRSLGYYYLRIVRFASAEAELTKALELFRAELTDDHPDTARAMEALADLHMHAGRHEQAAELIERVLAYRTEHFEEDHFETLWSLCRQGENFYGWSRFDQAEEVLTRALDRCRSSLSQDESLTYQVLLALGGVYTQRGDVADAGRSFTEALEGLRRTCGERAELTLLAARGLAQHNDGLGRYEVSEPLWAFVVPAMPEVFGVEHSNTLTTDVSFASHLYARGRYVPTHEQLEETLPTLERLLGETHISFIQGLTLQGHVQRNLGSLDKAIATYERALMLSTARNGPEDPMSIALLTNIATLRTELQDFAGALLLYEDAIELSLRALPKDFYGTGLTFLQYGHCLMSAKRYKDAERAYLEAHDRLTPVFGAQHEYTVRCASGLSRLYTAWGRPEHARTWSERLPPANAPDANSAR